MTSWWLWLLAAVVLVVVAAVTVALCVVAGQSEERRGGLLELDTWEARNALKHGRPRPGRPGDAVARASTRFVARCGHLIDEDDPYIVRASDLTRWCSERCERRDRLGREHGVAPFAGGAE